MAVVNMAPQPSSFSPQRDFCHSLCQRCKADCHGTPSTTASRRCDKRCPSSQSPLRYELQSSHSELVGNVLLDGIDEGRATHSHVEFLQVAETKFHQVDSQSKGIQSYPSYLIIMVEWNRDYTVATRLGIRVYKGSWDAAQPKLIFIQLA